MVLSIGVHPNECVKERYPTDESKNLTNNLETVCEMGCKLVLKSMTLNDLEWRNGLYFALFYRIW